MSGEHAVLAPSSASRWVLCHGSVLLEAMYPETEEKPEAAEGTATHWGAGELFYGRPIALGQYAPNGVVLSEEMIQGAEMYVDAVDRRLHKLGLTREWLHVEERVDIPRVHPLNWGTPDNWLYYPQGACLDVFDFKFGHEFVEIFENWQILDYTCGILDKLGIDGIADQSLTVNMHIVQPRSYHRDGPVRTWSAMASDLRGYFNKLSNSAHAAMQPGAKCTPNPECFHCKARHVCEALQRDAYRSAQISTSSIPVDMTPAALGLELHYLRAAAKRLEGRITGLKEQAKITLQLGQPVAFHALAPVEGREVWNKPVPEVISLGQMFGIDLAKKDAITPKQAVTAGMSAEVVAMYSERKKGLELVSDDGSQARKVFSSK